MINKKHFFTCLKIFTSISLMIYVFRSVELDSVVSNITKVDFLFLIMAFFLYVIQILIMTLRWGVVCKIFGFEIKFSTLIFYNFIGSFFNQILPSSIGGDAIRVYLIHRLSKQSLKSFLCVFTDRILSLIFLILIPLVFFLSKSKSSELIDSIIRLKIVEISFIITLIAYLIFRFAIKNNIASKLIEQLNKFSKYFLINKKLSFLIVIGSLANQFVGVFVFIALATALKINIDLNTSFIIFPLLLIFSLIPISIGGWGLREAVAIELLVPHGINSTDAASISIIYGLILLVVSLPGAFGVLELTRLKKKL
jgi:uncharacterized protein (TIRG00374 family)